jgi:hypothetical protein
MKHVRVVLTPKTTKAARHVAEAGNPAAWVVVERRYTVPHNERPGPWLLVRPDSSEDMRFHQRWVHETEDTHFSVEVV